jgi:signal recognition particle subunit SRP54
LSEADVDEILGEIRTALLEADVNVGVVRSVLARIRDKAVGEAISGLASK